VFWCEVTPPFLNSLFESCWVFHATTGRESLCDWVEETFRSSVGFFDQDKVRGEFCDSGSVNKMRSVGVVIAFESKFFARWDNASIEEVAMPLMSDSTMNLQYFSNRFAGVLQ